MSKEFLKYFWSFYGPKGLYPISGLTEKEVLVAVSDLALGGHNFAGGDSIDREEVMMRVKLNRLGKTKSTSVLF